MARQSENLNAIGIYCGTNLCAWVCSHSHIPLRLAGKGGPVGGQGRFSPETKPDKRPASVFPIRNQDQILHRFFARPADWDTPANGRQDPAIISPLELVEHVFFFTISGIRPGAFGGVGAAPGKAWGRRKRCR